MSDWDSLTPSEKKDAAKRTLQMLEKEKKNKNIQNNKKFILKCLNFLIFQKFLFFVVIILVLIFIMRL